MPWDPLRPLQVNGARLVERELREMHAELMAKLQERINMSRRAIRWSKVAIVCAGFGVGIQVTLFILRLV